MSQAAHRRRVVCCIALAVLVACAAGCSRDPLDEVRTLQTRGEYEDSIEPLRALIAERPDDPEVHYRYGLALAATQQATLAIWPLKKAMESPEWRVPAGLALAAALVATGSHDTAIEVCDRVLETEPDNTAALVQRAMARFHSRRDYAGALADAERALEVDPDLLEALVARCLALLALERVEEAAVALEALEGRYRDDTLGLAGSPELCAARASFAKEKGELEVAEQRYDACLEEFPRSAVVIDDALEFFDAIGRGERSMEILETTLEQMPRAHGYRWSLARRLQGAGRRDDALALLRAGTELDSPAEAAEAWSSLASFHAEEGEYAEAISALDQALALLAEPSPALLFTYADTLVLAGRYDEALAMAAKMELPAHRELVRGRVALVRGDPAAALEHFGAGIRLWPDNAAARYYAAVAAEQVGDFDRAIEEYRYAIRIDPKVTDAQLRLARLLVAVGDDDKALTVLTHRPGGRIAELESVLLQLRILARLGRARPPPAYLAPMLSQPENWGPAVAALARGAHDRGGAAAAVKVVREADRMDLADPANAAALEVLVESLAETGESAEGLAQVEASLRAQPEAAVFHALRGRALSLGGAPESEIRPAYERALELDPDEPRALLGLARLDAAGGNGESAAALYARAIAADPGNRTAVREAAALLVALGRREAAEERLETLLREHPYDVEAAIALAELRLARGAERERTLELARRAVHFRGGPDAEALLERVSASTADRHAAEAS
jgi:tetratricopeptide (TPR) repeat protein